MHIYKIYKIWFELVLWYINNWKSFNLEFFLYIGGSLNKFPAFYRVGTFIDSTHRKL